LMYKVADTPGLVVTKFNGYQVFIRSKSIPDIGEGRKRNVKDKRSTY